MKRPLLAFAAALMLASAAFAQPKRPLRADDIHNLKEVRDPRRSPDGKWVAYTVTRAIRETDKNDTDVWMVSWDGQQQIQLTFSLDSETSPRWSPDGKHLAFVSSRQGAKGGQIWLLNRAGGEAVKLTDVKGGVSDYEWSPDSKRFVLVVTDPDPNEADADKADKKDPPKTPKPIVVDRYRFKQDVRGYLDARRSHLYLYDIASKKSEALTTGSFDENSPSWSPDGTQIAFIRRHGEADVDKAPNQDVFVVAARSGAEPKRLTTTAAESGPIAWSPDGRTLSFLIGDDAKYSAHVQSKLAVMPASGGQPRSLTDGLDRPVRSPEFSRDGASIIFGIVDDRSEHLARMRGWRTHRTADRRAARRLELSPGPDDAFAVLASTATDVPGLRARPFDPSRASGSSRARSRDGKLGVVASGIEERKRQAAAAVAAQRLVDQRHPARHH
jgi:Tol biopolymer transport system component